MDNFISFQITIATTRVSLSSFLVYLCSKLMTIVFFVMKIVFFVILPILVSADRLLTILKSFRCRINMFDNHSTVFRFIHQLTWVSWSFMEVICLQIDEIVGFCQFNPLWSALINFQHQTLLQQNTTQAQYYQYSINLLLSKIRQALITICI